MTKGKKYLDAAKLVDKTKLYDSDEALALLCQTATAKFDETVEIHIREIHGKLEHQGLSGGM